MSKQANLFGGPEKETVADKIERIYKSHPRLEGRVAALKYIRAAIGSGEITASLLLERVQAYAAEMRRRGTERRYIQMASTWFSKKRYMDVPEKPPVDAVLSRQQAIGDAARRQEADIKRAEALNIRRREAAKVVLGRYGDDEVEAAYREHLGTLPGWAGNVTKLEWCTTFVAEILEPDCLKGVE